MKQIACPVHGTIQLSDIEVQLLGTRAMQRLRNVKQLGLVPYVFPGADFSRLGHSLGVSHVTAMILDSLRRQGEKVPDPDYRDYRLAAFLHDIGHYPFSHTTEHALETFYGSPTSSAVEPVSGPKPKSKHVGDYYNHEHLGSDMLETDDEIKRIFGSARPKVDPKRIGSLMRGEEPGIGNLVHSDLDADRLDYLPRTAIHAGLPYGRIDLDYLVSQISIDRDDRLCFSPKALNAVDHCLLGRYFDRMTIAFHKTVVGFELLLEQVLQDLFELNSVLKLTKADVRRMLQKGEWAAFDDDSIVAMIRKHLTTSAKPSVKARALAVLHREPLKLLAQLEYLGDRNDKDPFDVQVQIVERNIESWRKESASPFWTYWVKDGFTLTSLASSTPVSVARSITEQELEQSARIRRRNSQLSDPVTEVKQSLMSALGEKGYYALRVYALVGRPMINQAKVRQMLKRDLPGNRWVVTV